MASKQEYEHITCSECGEDAALSYMGEIGLTMREQTLCFNCAFWFEKIALGVRRCDSVVRINGRHYVIEAEPDRTRRGWQDGMVGHGGREFQIRFDSGREVVTHNLWYQGEIPERWQERLPDNATWGELLATKEP